MFLDGCREFVKDFGPGIFGRAFYEIVSTHDNFRLSFVFHEVVPQLFGIRIDVECQPLCESQPDDVGRKTEGSMIGKGQVKGVDQRVIEARGLREVSIGDYVLSGGELAAMVLLDACVRLLPGVMGAAESALEESFAGGQDHLLEYPHYTRPAEWQGRAVPAVLLSGHHAEVARWRRAQAERITQERRPDLWARHCAATAAMDGRPVPA